MKHLKEYYPFKIKNIKDIEDFGSYYSYKFSDITCVYLNKIPYMSPNLLTTIRNLILIHIIYKIVIKKNFKNIPVYVFLIGLIDTLDGTYARKYNMETKFGDYYDHISDITTTLILILLIYNYSKNKYDMVIIFIFLLLTLQHFVCFEKYISKTTDLDTGRNSVKIINDLCPYNDIDKLYNYLKKIKYVGYSTYYIIIAIIFSKMTKKID